MGELVLVDRVVAMGRICLPWTTADGHTVLAS
jgi:hypothetical protein